MEFWSCPEPGLPRLTRLPRRSGIVFMPLFSEATSVIASECMEKTERSSTVWVAWDDLFAWLLLPLAALFALELLLRLIVLRRLP